MELAYNWNFSWPNLADDLESAQDDESDEEVSLFWYRYSSRAEDKIVEARYFYTRRHKEISHLTPWKRSCKQFVKDFISCTVRLVTIQYNALYKWATSFFTFL